MTHIMVDLETWGVRPGCALRSIGAVAFDPVAGITGERFYRNITVDSCTDRGLTLDPKTVEWWESQSDAAKSAFDDDPVSVWSALAAFRGFWEANQGVEIWCYGANADEPWMVAAFAACGLEAPWHYRNVRCARTVLELAGVAVDRETGTHHHALDDAVQQAVAVIQAYRVLAIEAKRGAALTERRDAVSLAGGILQNACHGASRDAGWWNGQDAREPNIFATKLCLIHSEVSEAMEGDRKSLMDDKLPHREMAEVELADAAIRIFDLAGARSYDIGGAIAEKMAFNAVREDHKAEVRAAVGGKRY